MTVCPIFLILYIHGNMCSFFTAILILCQLRTRAERVKQKRQEQENESGASADSVVYAELLSYYRLILKSAKIERMMVLHQYLSWLTSHNCIQIDSGKCTKSVKFMPQGSRNGYLAHSQTLQSINRGEMY